MDKLSTNIQYVKGVGPGLARVLANRNIYTVGDLFFHFPYRYIDRRKIEKINEVTPGKDKVVIAEVVTSGVSFLGKRRARIYEVIATDGSGFISAKWFHFHPKFMAGRYKKDAKILFAGELSEYNNTKQFIHPETESLGEDDTPSSAGRLFPIYPLTEGISQRMLRKIFQSAWEKFSCCLLNPFPQDFMKKHGLKDLKGAVEYLHNPPSDADPNLLNERRTAEHRTVIFSEFFLLEVALAMKRAKTARESGIAFTFKKGAHDDFIAGLPFKLTGAQERVIDEIRKDMARSHPMNRLLQGDVGSGKTVVALAAALQASANGYQAAFMAPTEILAEQHFATVSVIADRLKVPCALLTASVKGEVREGIYAGVKSGAIPILIGTHAIIQDDVKFKNLGLAIIDEQHRFGVEQRLALHRKGSSPDILVMTATPIPRTLAMTLYGDLEVSVLDELPKGRKPIYTKVYFERAREDLYRGMRMELSKGHQIYVVYPLIEESEKIDLKNATEMSEELSRIFAPDYRVALLHGRMKGDEKDAIMKDFKAGRIHILAATSVVEVGVDVPNATVMMIEHAERFGLAQLHQLRGRVGRGDAQSYCVLVLGGPQSAESRARLSIMVETTDGFRVAEEDLRIRGPGEFLGTRQSGLPEFKMADIVRDIGILQIARQAAFEIVADDPGLELPKNRPFREAVEHGIKLDLGKVA